MNRRADGPPASVARTRRALVTAALDLLDDGGVCAVTPQTVAGRAGVPAGTAEHHFPTVDDLLAVVLDELVDRATDRLAELTRRARDGELSLLDASTMFVVDLLGPRRPEFLAHLRVRILVAGGAPVRSVPDDHDRRTVDLIAEFTGDRERARSLHAAVFQFAASAALSGTTPSPERIRGFLADLHAGYGLLPEPLVGSLREAVTAGPRALITRPRR